MPGRYGCDVSGQQDHTEKCEDSNLNGAGHGLRGGERRSFSAHTAIDIGGAEVDRVRSYKFRITQAQWQGRAAEFITQGPSNLLSRSSSPSTVGGSPKQVKGSNHPITGLFFKLLHDRHSERCQCFVSETNRTRQTHLDHRVYTKLKP
ncbi:hypothetical protein DPEC_G00245450 [Dallia pectoralis]|uniref:Uncharacterized protein n=1 Tax=Dallia pectoralis TaxID=75939 RepID=A0ACC2FW47_DALPE|nr:hypothetical protein DPEC_G00245450 [Dallia pectoralis]